MSHKTEDYNQDTVESSNENIHCRQDIDVSTQLKVYGLDLKGGLDLKLRLEHLQFIEGIKDFYLKCGERYEIFRKK